MNIDQVGDTLDNVYGKILLCRAVYDRDGKELDASETRWLHMRLSDIIKSAETMRAWVEDRVASMPRQCAIDGCLGSAITDYRYCQEHDRQVRESLARKRGLTRKRS